MIINSCRSAALRSPVMWNPWHTLRDMPWVTLHLRGDLPTGLRAATNCEQIVMSSRLLQRERRASLGHELEHIERGHSLACSARDEETVRQAAARRLVDLDALATALAWTRDVSELAEELWVDEETVRIRIRHLHPSERHYLQRRLAHTEESA